MQIKYGDSRVPTVEDIEFLYGACEWWHAEIPARTVSALEGSWRCVTARESGRLIGLVSAISDGELYAYVTHVLVHPQYRRMGVGSELMRLLLRGTEAYENVVTTTLTAEGKAFYESVGMREMEAGPTIEPHTMQRFRRPV